MQMQADLLGVDVVRPASTEATALGAAYLAGLAVGYWPTQDFIATQWKAECRFSPQMNDAARQQKRQLWSRALERSRGWVTR